MVTLQVREDNLFTAAAGLSVITAVNSVWYLRSVADHPEQHMLKAL